MVTDLEFYELRYSGKEAAFLRGFRAIYLGVILNVMIMATVALAAIKIGAVMLQLEPWQTLLIASIVTVIYSSLGGLRGVLITDFFQFIIAMIGAVGAAIVVLNLPEVGGVQGLINNVDVAGKLRILPDFNDKDTLLAVLIMPLAVQWWSSWYPGAEPGGGGYIAQRMLAAKNENHAVGATLLFNVAHYALRPWPWIIVALGSIVMYPTLESIQAAFPHVDDSVLGHDLAYSAMLTYLPAGLLGLVLASIMAAFMSTISTHLNWGSSYIVNDFYKRFINANADEKKLVRVGRISTVVLMILAALMALALQNALQAFAILVLLGAGTGLIFILRWFWWRINAYSEIAAMIISFFVAIYLQIVHTSLGFEAIAAHYQLIIGVTITSIGWIVVTFLTEPTSDAKLLSFYKSTKPGGPGWKAFLNRVDVSEFEKEEDWKVPKQILAMLMGCFMVYGALFATGFWIFGNRVSALLLTILAIFSAFVIARLWRDLRD